MARFIVSLGVLAFVLSLGCNQSPPAEKAPEATHDDHEHDDHAHEGHDHEGHDHAHGEHGHGEHGGASKTYAEAVEKVVASAALIGARVDVPLNVNTAVVFPPMSVGATLTVPTGVPVVMFVTVNAVLSDA